jgi:hypothetical protein
MYLSMDEYAAELVPPLDSTTRFRIQMGQARIIALLLLAGCSTLPDVERSYRECLTMTEGTAKYTVTAEMRQVECKR